MKNKNHLISSIFQYISTKKKLYISLTFISLLSLTSFIPLFLSNINGGYSWIVIAINIFSVVLITFLVFNSLFLETKTNQFDLILLSKSKTSKQVYFYKVLISLLIINIFILINSFFVSIIFSVYSKNYIWFIPVFLGVAFSHNLLTLILLLLFVFFTLVIKNQFMLMLTSIFVVLSIFSTGFGLKTIDDIKSNNINFSYNSHQVHNYANLYYEEDGQIKKGLVEQTNYKIHGPDNSLSKKQFNLENINPISIFGGLGIMAISKQLSNNRLITKSAFNINSNHFKTVNNFYKKKPNLKIKAIYPIGITPLFELNHLEIESRFKKLYNSFIKKGYKDDSFDVVRGYVDKNHLWDDVSSQAPFVSDILLSSTGIKGNLEWLYWIGEKEELFRKDPNLFQWMSSKTSNSFSKMIEGIYKNPNSTFNIKNINVTNRNEFIEYKVLDDNFKPTEKDVEYFKKQMVLFNNQIVEINKNTLNLPAFEIEFAGIKNITQWSEYIDKKAFHLKDLKDVFAKLKKLDPSIPEYTFEKNVVDISDFHYQYTNNTNSPSVTAGISTMAILILVCILVFLINTKISKANMKGF